MFDSIYDAKDAFSPPRRWRYHNVVILLNKMYKLLHVKWWFARNFVTDPYSNFVYWISGQCCLFSKKILTLLFTVADNRSQIKNRLVFRCSGVQIFGSCSEFSNVIIRCSALWLHKRKSTPISAEMVSQYQFQMVLVNIYNWIHATVV